MRTGHEEGWSTDLALQPASFHHLEQQLGLVDRFASCTICGDDITPSRMKNHQKTNSVCRFLADTVGVRTFWKLGYRDPYLLQGNGIPITWTEMQSRVTWTEMQSRVAWRARLHIVRFRLWTAVMISAS